MTITTSVIITGKVTGGDWTRADSDVYVGYDNLQNYIYNNYKGRNIRITIDILPDELEEE